MDYIRFFSREKGFNAWPNAAPEIKHLLDCFDVKLNMDASCPVVNSVFHARNDVERLQNVASFFSTNPRKAQKQFGLRITTEDCDRAGIQIAMNRGETGVRFVDERHADLVGTSTEFKSLATIIIVRIWEGEQRLQAFPPHSILGEVAVISNLADQVDDGAVVAIEPGARAIEGRARAVGETEDPGIEGDRGVEVRRVDRVMVERAYGHGSSPWLLTLIMHHPPEAGKLRDVINDIEGASIP